MLDSFNLSNIGSLLQSSLSTTLSGIINIISHPKLSDIVDIAIVAFLIYELITLVRQTRAAQLMKGILVLFIAWFVSSIFDLRTMKWLLNNILQFGMLALVVIFQPELRRALEQVGRTNVLALSLFRPKTLDEQSRERMQNAIATVCDAAEQMSDSRTGALIVFERRSNLGEIIKTGTQLNSDINVEALGTIFYEGTPLHDGAVVVRDARIKAAGCVLPLSANLEISKDMGTRHRAALGMSENSDAVCVVVSEETGIVSLAKNGVLIRRLDRQNLFNLLKIELLPEPPSEEEKRFGLKLRRKGEKKDEEKTV
ncbi:MAG: diadenylate cyclase CdaA [Pygmaiobacter massiliensis]|nr:diadenylate cyclase CdaA [Pygmaiobacter massiliensis]